MKSFNLKIDTKKYQYSFFSLLALFFTYILISFSIQYSFYLYLVVLGCVLAYYILNDTKFFKSWVILVTSVFWSSSLLILLSGLFALVSFPISVLVLYLPLFLLIPLLLLKPVDIRGLEFKPGKEGLIMIFFTVVSLVSHVYSVRGFIAPILHDPIAHATWAKEVYDTGLINYFYSPGLHILSALGMMSSGLVISQSILIITNIFNSLSFVPIYLFINEYFKNKMFAMISALLFIIALFPSKFFWAAGKNALVLAIPFIFLALFLSALDLKKIKKFVVLNLIVFTLILIHYPTAAIALIGVFFILIYKEGLKGLYNLIAGVFIGVVWGALKLPYQIEHLESSVSSGVSDHQVFNLANIITFLEGIYTQVVPVFSFPFGNIVLFSGIIGLSIMFLITLKKKSYLYFSLFFWGNIFVMLLIEFVDKLSSLHIVYLTQMLIFFVFLYIGVGFLWGEVILPYLIKIEKKFEVLFYLGFLFLLCTGSYKIFNVYEEKQESINMVSVSDINLFDWMEKNLDCEDEVLNNANVGTRKTVVFASDAGAWIPVFTNFQIAMPFTEFAAQETHDNYALYEKILKGDYSCEDIDLLLNKKIRYYYKGSKGVFGGQIVPDSDNFKLLYEKEKSSVYEIIPCE